MLLFPAIDILDGKSVRLLHGRFDRVTVYGDPVEMAVKWTEQGAQYLHVVDLNGALDGRKKNAAVIKAVTDAVKVPVQLGGGIRSTEDIDYCLSALKVARVILGTVCCRQPEVVSGAVKRFGSDRIVCGIDARDGKTAVKGWLEDTCVSPYDLGKDMFQAGVKTVVYTDIGRDGALTGINVASCIEMMQKTGLNVIASGGLSRLEEIRELTEAGLHGVILGKAIYEEKFTVREALEVSGEEYARY